MYVLLKEVACILENKLSGNWGNQTSFTGTSYTCGYCSSLSGPSIGYKCLNQDHRGSYITTAVIYICPNCKKPTFVDKTTSQQTPGIIIGEEVMYLPTDISQLYNEARNCISVNAFTSSVLSCRKLLMNIAVSKGAKPGESFVSYVKYLEENHFIPPNSRGWVDHIRSKGNEATHEINSMNKEDAIELLEFAEMLLRFIYEMPGRMSKYMIDK